MISSDKEYVSDDDCAETRFVDGNVYNNTSMLAGKKTIFVNATSIVSSLRRERSKTSLGIVC